MDAADVNSQPPATATATPDEVEKEVAGCMTPDCIKQHKPEITELVRAYNGSKDWDTMRKELEAVMDHSSEAYTQLQDADTVFAVGMYGHTQLASLLLCSRMPVNTTSYSGLTMLHGAAWGGHLQLVRLLLDRGANVHARSKFRNTPLMLAAQSDNLEVLQCLVQAGANTKARNGPGDSALSFARIARYPAVIQYLEQLPQ